MLFAINFIINRINYLSSEDAFLAAPADPKQVGNIIFPFSQHVGLPEHNCLSLSLIHTL